VLEIGLALASALEHAHARGVIHRDVKPQNVLVPHPPQTAHRRLRRSSPAAKLADFARQPSRRRAHAYRDVLGTASSYCSGAEGGGEIGMAADLYSLALVIYERCPDQAPCGGDTRGDRASVWRCRCRRLRVSAADLPNRAMPRTRPCARWPGARAARHARAAALAFQDALSTAPQALHAGDVPVAVSRPCG